MTTEMKVHVVTLQVCLQVCFQVRRYLHSYMFSSMFSSMFTRDRGFIFIRTSMIQVCFQKNGSERCTFLVKLTRHQV
jgi:hypothetical protein